MESPLTSTATMEPTNLTKQFYNRNVRFVQYYTIFIARPSGLVDRINGVIKTPVAKLTESFNLPWPKAVPFVLLNLRSTAFGEHQLSPFEIITG